MEMKNSATTAPTKARPIARRRPASRYGKDDGSVIPNQTSVQRARQARATSRYSAGTERAPSLAFMAMGKKAAKTTVASRAAGLYPNQMVSSGRMATIGIA